MYPQGIPFLRCNNPMPVKILRRLYDMTIEGRSFNILMLVCNEPLRTYTPDPYPQGVNVPAVRRPFFYPVSAKGVHLHIILCVVWTCTFPFSDFTGT